jgi:hypothetical protein
LWVLFLRFFSIQTNQEVSFTSQWLDSSAARMNFT